MRTRAVVMFSAIGLVGAAVSLWAGAVFGGLLGWQGQATSGALPLLSLLSLAALSAAALWPARWARWLPSVTGRALLPLAVALLSLPLGLALLVALSVNEISLSAHPTTFTGVLLLGALGTLFFARRGLVFFDPTTRSSWAGCAAAALGLALGGTALGAVASRSVASDQIARATQAFVRSLTPVASFDAIASKPGEVGATSDDPLAITPTAEHAVDLSTSEESVRLEVQCRAAVCRFAVLALKSPQRPAARVFFTSAPVGTHVEILRRGDGLLVLALGRDLHLVDLRARDGRPLLLSDLAGFLALPRLWRLSPAVALLAVLALLALRRRAVAWQDALAQGLPARVQDGALILREGRTDALAPAGVRDGPVVLLGARLATPTYRESGHLQADLVLRGRQERLLAKAHANTMMLDAWALAIAALAATPVLVAALCGLL